MIDTDRMSELRAELGSEDLAMILDVFLAEAEETLDRLSGAMSDDERGKALHFLRSGALNLGLQGLAEATMGQDVDPGALSTIFEATRSAATEAA